jgi:predicted MPP superfamily phosphohydrolase
MRSARSLIPLALLGLLHAYIGWRILPDLPVGPGMRWLGALLLAVSSLSIPMGLLLRSVRERPWLERIALLGLLMMSLFSSLFVFTLLRDLALGTVALFLSDERLHAAMSASASFVVLMSAFATIAGLVGARRIARVVNIDVPIANLPKALEGFTIAQISDIHVGPTIKRAYVEGIVDAVNGLQADVIAVTGDVVDGSVRELAPHTEPLKRLNAKYGAYLVTGNHEYYSGEHAWTAEFKRLGLRVLMNEHVVLTHNGARLVVAGVADYSAHHFNPAQRSDPKAALSNAPADAAPRILLAHQPRSARAAADAGFDLQLSGHTHGGQFWPWNHFVRLQQPFTAGLHRLNQLWVYISRGTGYWGPPNRFGAPSEISRLRLVAA